MKPALEECGYIPLRIDRVEHNDQSDDQIIAGIRSSGLLIAEFTGHRAGVYFELGLEYIVRFFDSRLRSVDVSWKTPDSFKNGVRVAILARVARLSGPLGTGPGEDLRLDQRT